jgi:hypothetical protein
MPEAVRDSVGELVPEQVEAPAARPEPAPPRSQRRLIQLAVDQGTYDKLSYAQALLSHAIPSGDVAQVLDRALDALIRETEKRRFAATKKPRPRQSSTANRRHVPSHVKRAVWERDQGQCTFVSSTGHRCSARKFLEFDHVDPVARGGHASVDRMRLRCRAHSQYEAERVFGAGFMGEKRDEARRAVECSATGHGTTLEERIRAALRFLGRKPVPPAESRRAERRPGGSWGAGAGPGPSGSARSAMSSIGSP